MKNIFNMIKENHLRINSLIFWIFAMISIGSDKFWFFAIPAIIMSGMQDIINSINKLNKNNEKNEKN